MKDLPQSPNLGKRLVVCVDVDDACFDFPTSYAAWLTDQGRQSFHPLVEHHYDFPTLLNITREQYLNDCTKMLSELVEVPPIPGCLPALDHISESDIAIWLLSARAPEQRAATVAWAERWSLPVEGVVCVGDSRDERSVTKASVCATLRAAAHIDDNPDHLWGMVGSLTAPIAFGDFHWSTPGPWLHAKQWEEVMPVLAKVLQS